ncbi:MAG TPA: GNAT family N-acetyltransferase [Kofleriaceae bacterium]|nr:GNAT family N-acetyltransferase [Kofleriaceae bacterium]
MVVLEQVDVDDVRFARLLQLYLHEWSAVVSVPIDEQARFDYEELPLYRDHEARAIQLVLGASDRLPVGFAMISRDDAGCRHVEEFFVIAGARRQGLGARAAAALFAAGAGRWTLTVRPENPGGLAFWRRVVPGADERVEPGDDGVARTRLTFTMPPP